MAQSIYLAKIQLETWAEPVVPEVGREEMAEVIQALGKALAEVAMVFLEGDRVLSQGVALSVAKEELGTAAVSAQFMATLFCFRC